MQQFIQGLPKAELHLHIEGSLEPELMFALAERNGIQLAFKSVEEVRAAYQFEDLQSFLDIYYQGAKVLLQEQDFYELAMAYLTRAHEDNVRHVEIFFDPQTHTERGVHFEHVINGLHRALLDAERQFGLSHRLIMCFLRHLDEQSAFETLNTALAYKDKIYAVGLDSSERNNPPTKFARVFKQARDAGFVTVAHAGEEGPSEYIWQALDELAVKRIDHGVRCTEDEELINHLRQTQIPLTVCPLSNIKLRVFPELQRHNLKELLDKGLCVTVNSDDPAYFGGYINQNYLDSANALRLTKNNITQLAKNSFNASFIDHSRRAQLIAELDEYVSSLA